MKISQKVLFCAVLMVLVVAACSSADDALSAARERESELSTAKTSQSRTENMTSL